MQAPSELIVATPAEFAKFLEHLSGCSVVGFDTEFIGEQFFQPQLCLVQVATPDRLFILDPIELADLKPFWEIVADPNHTVVVHAGREEIRMCLQQLGRAPTGLFDVQIAAGLIGAGYPSSHAALVQQFLRIRLSKGETLTDWARRPLTRQQIRYAFDDVRFLLPLHDRMRRRLEKLGRLSWLNEEMDVLLRRSTGDEPSREPWRKLRGLGPLDRQGLSIVREVFSWREERAATVNRPARYMLRDDLIIEIARRMPSTEKDLTVMRGVGRHDLIGLLTAVQRGKNAAADTWPAATERDNDPPQVGIVANFLIAALNSYCTQNEVSSSLAITTSDVKALIRAKIDPTYDTAECALCRGWRAEFILPLLNELLHGKRSVCIGQLKSASPLELAK